MTDEQTTQTTEIEIAKFNPNRYLRDIKGQPYLPVAARLAWFRHDHRDGIMETTPHSITPEIAIFHARITTQDGASATGYGSCTPDQFPAGWIEKAETKALGRALAALGYGTLATDDFDDDGALADAPVSFGGDRGQYGDGPHGPSTAPAQFRRPASAPQGGYPLATDKQKGMIERRTREAGLTAADVEVYVREHYGAALADLGKRDASELIDALGAGQVPKAPVSGGSPDHAEAQVQAAYARERSGPPPAPAGLDPVTRFWSAARKHGINQQQAALLTIDRFGRPPAELEETELGTIAAELEGMTTDAARALVAAGN